MRTKLGNIVVNQGALAKLIGGEIDDRPIPAPTCSAQMAYTLSLLRKEAIAQLEFFEVQRNPIAKRFGEVVSANAVKDGDTDEAKAEKAKAINAAKDEFQKAVAELLDVEVVMPTVGRIKLSRFEAEKISLDAGDYLALEWLIKPDLAAMFEAED
ncbi:hypothetical protein ANAEL_02570 [Anaerolineales bacterium]|nr:hypothetical protein ANAEL_02570 [Anaerolineales bacterium]